MIDAVRVKVEEAVGLAWDEYKGRHPQQAEAIESQFGEPLVFILKKLENDADYQALLTKTEAEVQIANLVEVVAPLVLSVLGL